MNTCVQQATIYQLLQIYIFPPNIQVRLGQYTGSSSW